MGSVGAGGYKVGNGSELEAEFEEGSTAAALGKSGEGAPTADANKSSSSGGLSETSCIGGGSSVAIRKCYNTLK
jgi:hypothetical protein